MPVRRTDLARVVEDLPEETILDSMRVPAAMRMRVWNAALQEHRNHPSFRVRDWPFTREQGFTCECSGNEVEWRVTITTLRDSAEELRVLWRQLTHTKEKKRLREKERSEKRAKALLHRFLSKEQRWALRAGGSFPVVGQDGRTYTIAKGNANNIRVEYDGAPLTLCVHFEDWGIPVYDLMLAQKVLLENDLPRLLRTANARNEVTKESFKGERLLGVESPKGERLLGVESPTLAQRDPFLDLQAFATITRDPLLAPDPPRPGSQEAETARSLWETIHSIEQNDQGPQVRERRILDAIAIDQQDIDEPEAWVRRQLGVDHADANS